MIIRAWFVNGVRVLMNICGTMIQRTCQTKVALVLFLGAMIVTGCSPRYHDMPPYWPIPTREYDNYGPGRFKTSYLASQIEKYYRGSVPGPIGVTTFVNIDDLYTSSTFGRMVGEQLMSELTMHGFDVIELRHTDALQFLDSDGEFALSRDVRQVRPERNLAAIVVGTYVASPQRVYLNARLVDPATSLVLSAGSVEMSRTPELTKLLRGGTLPGSLERIPVKHLGQDTYPINPYDRVRNRQYDLEESDGSFALPRNPPSAVFPPPVSNRPTIQEAPKAHRPPPVAPAIKPHEDEAPAPAAKDGGKAKEEEKKGE